MNLPISREDRKYIHVFFIVMAGFVAGVVFLFYIIATDL
jgi:phage shock protein PspC (stress-responsive transcriptional regulator)